MAKDAGTTSGDGLGRLRVAFALLSVGLLGVLAIAPATSHFTEWRAVQQRYNVAARRARLAPIEVRVRQVPSPAVDDVDRCGSCHLGAAGIAPVAGDPLFAAHPPIPHDPSRFGCTICHGGQGRAVTERAAHGGEPNWEEPLLEPPFREAGCGRCHSRVPLADPEQVAAGRALFVARGCGTCHGVDGRQVADKRDLSTVGLAGYSPRWQGEHVRAAAGSRDERWAASPLPLIDAERSAIEAYLDSLIGAPRLVAGKLLVAQFGCRGCHRINGVGGDGPDLSDIGERRASDLDFSRVRGEHTVAGWLRELLSDPGRLDPDSGMPTPGLTPPEIDQVVTYLLSLRTDDISAAFWPRDRLRGVSLGERDFPTGGRALFRAFCSACHGAKGEGRKPGPGGVTFAPAIGGAAFLAIASDAFLARTVRQGRPEHMPAWGAFDGGLRPDEIDAVVSYLRTLQPSAPSFAEVAASGLDLARGRATFQQACAPCHGDRGEGTAIGAPLAVADNPVTARDDAIYGTLVHGVENTAMGAFRTFDASTLRALIGAVRALEPTASHRNGWRPRAGDPERGRALFHRYCVVCHGARPGGRKAPAIDDPRVIATAPSSFLTASIVRRHDRTEQQLRRTPDEVADLVAYLRRLSPVRPAEPQR
jgi:mono/diheme cytochrome c family protein